MSKKDGGASKQANLARQDEAQRQATIRQGTASINNTFDSQFTPGFFDQQRANYVAYAQPQLDDQYGKAQRSLTYALTRDGNLDSSARAYQLGELAKTYQTASTGIANQGQDYANQARSSVEDARSGLISQVNATGDATQAANSAVSRATALAQPAAYSPISDVFSAGASALTAQGAAERAQALSGGAYKAPYNTGLFGATGAVKLG